MILNISTPLTLKLSPTIIFFIINYDQSKGRKKIKSLSCKDVLHTINYRLPEELVAVCRVGASRFDDGVVKMQMRSADAKIQALRGKVKLKESDEFKRVFLRSSMSHEARLLDQNFCILLNQLPSVKETFFVDSTGRLKQKPEPQHILSAQAQSGNAAFPQLTRSHPMFHAYQGQHPPPTDSAPNFTNTLPNNPALPSQWQPSTMQGFAP